MNLQFDISSTGAGFDVAISPRDEGELVASIERAHLQDGMSAEAVFAVVRQTRSSRVRNAAALAIVDLGDREGASDVLAEVLARPSVAHEAGTLVYALDEIGGSLPLSPFVNLVELGSSEAREEAMLLLESGRVVARSEEELDAARDRLSVLANLDVSERKQAARDALDALALGSGTT